MTLTVLEVVPPGPVQLRLNVVFAVSAELVREPLGGRVPLQPPEAVQLVAFSLDQITSTVAPEETVG